MTNSDAIERHIISVLVDNEPGVLARVIGLFSGRGYNIESLTVAEVDSKKHLSRISIVTSGTPMVIEHCIADEVGALNFAFAILSAVVAKLKVVDLLQSMPGVGKVRAQEIMRRIGIADSRRLRGLGANQVQALLREFGQRER